MNSKRLINNLLTRRELINLSLNVKVTMLFLYDRPFYFITIKDVHKIILNLNQNIIISESIKNIRHISSPVIEYFNQICKAKTKNLNINKIKMENDNKNNLNNFYPLSNDNKTKVITSIEVNKNNEGVYS